MDDQLKIAKVKCPYCGLEVVPKDDGSCPECRTDLTLILALDETGRAYHENGRRASASGRHAEAARNLLTAHEIMPDEDEYALDAGDALGRAGDVDEARRLVSSVSEHEGCKSRADGILSGMEQASREEQREGARRRVRTLVSAGGLLGLGAAVALGALLTVRALGPSPDRVVADALSHDPLTASLHLDVQRNGHNVALVGTVPSDESKWRAVSAAASTGQPIDASGIEVDASLGEIVACLSGTDGGPAEGLTWQVRDGVLRVGGIVNDSDRLDDTRKALERQGIFHADLSGIETAYQIVTVKPGDTLWAIAERFCGSGVLYRKILKPDGRPVGASRRLHAGDRLLVPVGLK